MAWEQPLEGAGGVGGEGWGLGEPTALGEG
jgi:hypothetical protein